MRPFAESARSLFEAPEFFACFTDGLRTEGAFVRYHYIQFTQKLVPLMQKVVQPEKLAGHVKNLIDCFCELLNLADISAYEAQTRAGKNLINYTARDLDERANPT